MILKILVMSLCFIAMTTLAVVSYRDGDKANTVVEGAIAILCLTVVVATIAGGS